MNVKLETEFSKADILQEVDALKKQIDDMRPLPADVEGRVMQKLRLDWNYNSNAIEGNKLSYGETAAFLSEGITAKGKPLKDHLDIKGHNEAINFLLDIVKDSRAISETDIRALHKMILVEPYEVKAQTASGASTTKRISLGEYKTSPNHVKTSTGELHYYATPEETPAKMQELMEWYIAASGKEIHPIVIAALFHHKFVAIHPFDDGNGRLSRILMNLIVMQSGYPPIVIKMDDRQNYYSLLRRADIGDSWPFVYYIMERLQKSLEMFLNAANGKNIDEDDDIDKEIALFKKELNNNINLTDKKSAQSVNRIIEKEVRPLLQKILDKSKEFDELFFTNNKFIRYRFQNSNGSPTSYREDIIENQITLIKESISKYDIDKLEFICLFKEFKQADKMFDINVNVSITFGVYKYSIYDFTTNKIVDKYYHEALNSQETYKIIMSLVVALKDKINEKLK